MTYRYQFMSHSSLSPSLSLSLKNQHNTKPHKTRKQKKKTKKKKTHHLSFLSHSLSLPLSLPFPFRVYPLLLHTRLYFCRQVVTAVRSSIVNDGLLSLWKGWSPLLWRDVPFCALYFTIYELLKSTYLQYHDPASLDVLHCFGFAALSSSVGIYSSLSFPQLLYQIHSIPL